MLCSRNAEEKTRNLGSPVRQDPLKTRVEVIGSKQMEELEKLKVDPDDQANPTK